jgi:membrane-associated phospholipid phosphatase
VIAIMAILFFGRRGALYILPAALVAYSRIYCGSHWPSDILVSILLAAGFSLLAASGFNGLYERFAPRMFPALFERHPSLLGSYRR